jgi:hypothetical protein
MTLSKKQNYAPGVGDLDFHPATPIHVDSAVPLLQPDCLSSPEPMCRIALEMHEKGSWFEANRQDVSRTR